MTSITRVRARSPAFSLALSLTLALTAGPALAQSLELPSNARLTRDVSQSEGVYSAPIAPYSGGNLPVFDIEGRVSKRAYRIPQQGLTPQQILSPIEASLEAAGFDQLFKCSDRFCGGFDFRFAAEVLPAPDMVVDLFDYTFVTARRATGSETTGDEYITLLASRDSTAGYLQIIQVTPEGGEALETGIGAAVIADTPTVLPQPKGSVPERLESNGYAVLSDLQFQTGSSDLGEGPFASLTALADYLNTNTSRKVALVGHTDTVGSLSGNIALSKRRAASVMARLRSEYGVAAGQMEAEGMGYLSPITSNLTDTGREANRRVEVILLNTE